ncbi:MAG: hypothetical protein U5J98_07965 [Halobacteriales archaeon]|nr:hypothetical protein [Halobacteriales archaeon]
MSTTCDTTTAFDTDGIPDGVDLVHRTRYRLLAAGDASFEPTEPFLGRVDRAFRAAYIAASEVPLVPEPLDVALEDAAALTAEEYAGRADADLRGEVLPAYDRTLVGLFCRYLEDAPDVGIWLADDPR